MVEWKKIGDVCSFNRGKTITAKNAVDGDIPVIAGGQNPSYYHNESNRTGESITVAGSGAYAGFVAYWNKPIFVSDAFTVDPSDKLLHKYLFQWLKMNQTKIFATQKGAGVPHVHGKDIANFLIPIPSLDEQNRIVGILDTFTDSIENLKQQIAQRRKQFEFYRDQLLDLEGKEGVEMKTLGEICDIKGDYGISASSKPFDGNCRYIRITDITDSGSLNDDVVSADYNKPVKEALKEGDILFARTGATVGKTLLFHKEYGECLFAGYLIRYRVKTMIALPKFVFHFAHSNDYYKWVKANLVEGAQPNISALKYNSLQIPVPSLPEQSRIVSILDTFEASISNLEAQLEQRQKQYEYYRNQLLTFE